MTERFRILVVCTANQCRSPMAEFLLREALIDKDLNWQISSAGTHATDGQWMHPYTTKVLESRRIGTGGWRTRAVDATILENVDLVLTATRQHRSHLTAIQPGLRGRTYPILQFARLASLAQRAGNWSPDRDSPSTLINVASRLAATGATEADDLADPIGRPYRHFVACATKLDQAIEMLLQSRSRTDRLMDDGKPRP